MEEALRIRDERRRHEEYERQRRLEDNVAKRQKQSASPPLPFSGNKGRHSKLRSILPYAGSKKRKQNVRLPSSLPSGRKRRKASAPLPSASLADRTRGRNGKSASWPEMNFSCSSSNRRIMPPVVLVLPAPLSQHTAHGHRRQRLPSCLADAHRLQEQAMKIPHTHRDRLVGCRFKLTGSVPLLVLQRGPEQLLNSHPSLHLTHDSPPTSEHH